MAHNPEHADEIVDEQWRRFAVWALVALAALAISLVMILGYASRAQNAQEDRYGQAQHEIAQLRSQNDTQSQQIRDLTSQVGVNAKQGDCRSRISTWAAALDSNRNSLGWEILIDRAIAGPNPETLRPKVQELNDLNSRVAQASDLRARSVDICADNPSYMPPS